ncbi:hypothetical protein SAMN05216241_101262 [Limimonas halophila]|uniref:Osmotically inducible lipoprotein OsmB n=1 Tax=Limimonas halophila TaxID=1082479 RepID=A0A1G7LJZ2_9PROT|nr:hypothetical protein [Limimonas halophila]SDF49269.1 hypothetical protein SAMN05216241_101262 [Limimonas halophila]
MKRLGALVCVVLMTGALVSACSTREVLSGAAGAGAGYIVGKEVHEDDDD